MFHGRHAIATAEEVLAPVHPGVRLLPLESRLCNSRTRYAHKLSRHSSCRKTRLQLGQFFATKGVETILKVNQYEIRLDVGVLSWTGNVLQEVKNSGWIGLPLPSWTPGTDPCVSDWVGIDCDTTGNIITL